MYYSTKEKPNFHIFNIFTAFFYNHMRPGVIRKRKKPITGDNRLFKPVFESYFRKALLSAQH